MLRDLRVNGAAAPDAAFAADVAMSTGMAVVKNHTTGTCAFASAATANDIYFVQKARIPYGIEASLDDFSDYDAMFNTVAAGDKVVLVSYTYGDVFATDAHDLTASDAGKRVAAGADGKLAVASGASKYLFTGIYDDCGHQLARIEVVDAAANA